MSNLLPKIDLSKVSNDLDSKLQDLAPDYKKDASPNKSLSKSFGKFKISLDAQAAGEIAAMSGETKTDPDGVVALPAQDKKAEPGLKVEWKPQLKLTHQQFLLKSSIGVEIKASLQGASDGFKASLERIADWRISNYRRHPASTKLKTALRTDLGSFVFPFDHKGLWQGLGNGDAVMLRSLGELTGKVSFSATDAITSNIFSIGRLLGAATPFSFALSQSIKFSASVKVVDQFRLVVSRQGSSVRLAVLRDELDKVDVSFNWKVSIGLTDETKKAIKKVANDLAKNIFGSTLDALESWAENFDPAQGLLENERVQAVAERLGIDLDNQPLDDLIKGVKELRAKLIKAITDAAETSASVGFEYEYARQEVNTAIVQLLMPVAQFKASPALVSAATEFDIEQLLSLAAKLGARVEADQESWHLTEKISTGFSFALGKYKTTNKLTKKRDLCALRKRVGTDQNGLPIYHQRIAFDSEIDLDNGKFGRDWFMELKADSKEYLAQPTLADLDLGFHFTLMEMPKRLNADTVDRVIDRAVVYGLIPLVKAESWRSAILDRIEGGGDRFQAKFDIQIRQQAARDLVSFCRDIARNGDKRSDVLSFALPWENWEGRRDFVDRVRLYKPVFAQYGEATGALQPRDMRDLAVSHLKDHGLHRLADYEGRNGNAKRARLIYWLLKDNSHCWQRLRQLEKAMRMLSRSSAGVGLAEIRKEVLIALTGHTRRWPEVILSCVGRFIHATPIEPSSISRTLSLVQRKKEGDATIVFGNGEPE